MKCSMCGKDFPSLEEAKIYLNDEFLSSAKVCPDCLEKIKQVTADPNFGKHLLDFSKDLVENWEKGTKENTDIGSVVKIFSLKGEEDGTYVGRTGIVENIDDAGQLFGTWGSLAIIPEEDDYAILRKEA